MGELERYVALACARMTAMNNDGPPTQPSAKQREKMLERELAKLAGENWQARG